jgi:PleD family two-component response regulator
MRGHSTASVQGGEDRFSVRQTKASGSQKETFSSRPASDKEEGNVNPLRILIADDHDLVRRGIRQLLKSYPVWHIFAEAKTGRDAVADAQELKPDIAILDINMPHLNGLGAT